MSKFAVLKGVRAQWNEERKWQTHFGSIYFLLGHTAIFQIHLHFRVFDRKKEIKTSLLIITLFLCFPVPELILNPMSYRWNKWAFQCSCVHITGPDEPFRYPDKNLISFSVPVCLYVNKTWLISDFCVYIIASSYFAYFAYLSLLWHSTLSYNHTRKWACGSIFNIHHAPIFQITNPPPFSKRKKTPLTLFSLIVYSVWWCRSWRIRKKHHRETDENSSRERF